MSKTENYIKVLPHNTDAEQSVIGCCLIDKYSTMVSVEQLEPNDFYREDHKIIFTCISNLFARDEPVDIITLKEEITSLGKIDEVGGLQYIASLPEKIPTTANIEKYINIIKEKSVARKLINMSNEIAKMGFDQTINNEQLTEYAERKIFEITQRKDIKGASRLKELLLNSITNLENIYNNGTKKGVSTGFSDIDRRMGGLRGSELIILAARPGMGKSAFALNVATNVARKENIPVLIFNLEMGKEQLTDRIICSEALINSSNYRNGKVSEDDWNKLTYTLNELAEVPIFIDDNSSVTISEIRTKCRKMSIEEKIGLVIIDYLQLITPSNNKASREQEVAEISRALKILAKELKIPIIALSQLSRANEKRNSADKKPMLSDLRDSGSIEQDADIVLFIHREDYYNVTNENKNIAEIIFAKHRAGEPRDRKLTMAWRIHKVCKYSERRI